QLQAAPKRVNVPYIRPEQLEEPDGILMGIPTRFGVVPAQFKQFWDKTLALWASQNGGQETTAYSFLPVLVHHGIMFVPLGYAAGPADATEIHGGSSFGAGTITGGDGSRMPSDIEISMAHEQGRSFARIIHRNFKDTPVPPAQLVLSKVLTAPTGANAELAPSAALVSPPYDGRRDTQEPPQEEASEGYQYYVTSRLKTARQATKTILYKIKQAFSNGSRK
ncbi:hypothetical protein EV182_003668, partial [Spiromyces aspiralis]